jgi:hypothetical protein
MMAPPFPSTPPGARLQRAARVANAALGAPARRGETGVSGGVLFFVPAAICWEAMQQLQPHR